VFRFIVFFLISLFIVDVSSTVLIVNYSGWTFPICLSFGTAMLGLLVIYYVSLRYGSLIRANMDQNILDDAGIDKFLLLLAGGLLILPGIFTDLVGLALLLRIVRRLVLIILPML
jgi:UPF0716 family protein affecting phage T7 exclusion